VKDGFAAFGRGDILALFAEDIEWIIPGEGWPLAGTYRASRFVIAVGNPSVWHYSTQA